MVKVFKETLNKSFDKLRTNGKLLIPFVVSPSTGLRTGLSNALLSEVEGHERNQLVQRFLNTAHTALRPRRAYGAGASSALLATVTRFFR